MKIAFNDNNPKKSGIFGKLKFYFTNFLEEAKAYIRDYNKNDM